MAARFERVECPAFGARRTQRARDSHADQAPITYGRGIGCNVFDVDGNRYVDLVAGFGALSLGHAPAALNLTLTAQAEELGLALGDVYGSEPKLALCERLARLYPLPGARVMLGLSGADAVTAAMKTAVLASGKERLIAFTGGYHGLSHGPLSACGLHESFRTPFAGQLGNHVSFVDYPTSENALERVLAEVASILKEGGIGAILVEPVLGRGGCVVPPSAFLPALRALCDHHHALLICDEIWTGIGRSGEWLMSAAAGVVADLVCVGKGLGGGQPISACIGAGSAMANWGDHGGNAIHTATHFGSPLASACALATLNALETENLPARALTVGAHWRQELHTATLGRGALSVDGAGLMVGVGIDGGAARALTVMRQLLKRGFIVLTGGTRGDIMTLTPPLTIDPELLSPVYEGAIWRAK